MWPRPSRVVVGRESERDVAACVLGRVVEGSVACSHEEAEIVETHLVVGGADVTVGLA